MVAVLKHEFEIGISKFTISVISVNTYAVCNRSGDSLVGKCLQISVECP